RTNKRTSFTASDRRADRSSGRAEHRHAADFDEEAGEQYLGDHHEAGRGEVRRVEVALAYLLDRPRVLAIDDVGAEVDDVLHGAAGLLDDRLHVLERFHGLRLDVRPDGCSIRLAADLARDHDDVAGLHPVGVALRDVEPGRDAGRTQPAIRSAHGAKHSMSSATSLTASSRARSS